MNKPVNLPRMNLLGVEKLRMYKSVLNLSRSCSYDQISRNLFYVTPLPFTYIPCDGISLRWINGRTAISKLYPMSTQRPHPGTTITCKKSTTNILKRVYFIQIFRYNKYMREIECSSYVVTSASLNTAYS